jgi:hypothetical protein
VDPNPGGFLQRPKPREFVADSKGCQDHQACKTQGEAAPVPETFNKSMKHLHGY